MVLLMLKAFGYKFSFNRSLLSYEDCHLIDYTFILI